jgi:hypothetical protein
MSITWLMQKHRAHPPRIRPDAHASSYPGSMMPNGKADCQAIVADFGRIVSEMRYTKSFMRK